MVIGLVLLFILITLTGCSNNTPREQLIADYKSCGDKAFNVAKWVPDDPVRMSLEAQCVVDYNLGLERIIEDEKYGIIN